MHNLGPSQLEQPGMYQEQSFEMPYETGYNGESPLQEIFAQESPHHEYQEAPTYEQEYQEAQYQEFPMQEAQYGMGPGEAQYQEYHAESPLAESAGETSEVFNEEEELAFAAELLEIQSEEELDRFLGKLVSRAVRGAGKFMRSPAGRMLGGVLRQVARRALPIAGKALGTFVGGPLGGMAAGHLTNMATQALGLEVEGLSESEAEFAAARQFIRFGSNAARRAASAYSSSPGVHPRSLTQSAFQAAAQQYAPGLLGPWAGRVAPAPLPAGRPRGIWVRRGRLITLYGV